MDICKCECEGEEKKNKISLPHLFGVAIGNRSDRQTNRQTDTHEKLHRFLFDINNKQPKRQTNQYSRAVAEVRLLFMYCINVYT